jgi:hypothetical protein
LEDVYAGAAQDFENLNSEQRGLLDLGKFGINSMKNVTKSYRRL